MLSAIVPTLNAGATLGPCLVALEKAGEIVVVDGGSADDTIAVARCAGARTIASATGRGIQLGAGANAARGEWLLFVHADTQLGSAWPVVVGAHIKSRPETAGCFRLRLDDDAWQARIIEKGVAARTSLLGLPYGDQGLLISRALYDAIGGFRPLPLMEDVDLVRRIGRRRMAMLGADALTSAERWRRDGWLRRSARNLACLALYKAGVAPTTIAKFYA